MDGEQETSAQRSQVREEITKSLERLHGELGKHNDLLASDTKEMEDKMEFTKSDLEKLKVAIETKERKSQNQIADLKMELRPPTDKSHGLQAQNSTLDPVLMDKEIGIQTHIAAITGAAQDPQAAFAPDLRDGLD